MSPENKKVYIAPGQKIYSHPDLIQDVLTERPRIPRHFELDPSNRCNLACHGCHFAYSHESNPQSDMPLSLFRKIVGEMKKGSVKAVTFTGGGEPLFNPNHLEFFKLTKEAGIEMGMYTNGVLLDGPTADFVARYFKWCYISLDATSAEEYQQYKKRGKTVFQRNIANLKAILNHPQRQAVIGIGYLLSQDNYMNLSKTAEYLLELKGETGASYVQLRPLVDVGTYQEQTESRQMKGLAFQTDKEIWQEHYSWVLEALNIIDSLPKDPDLITSRKKFLDLYKGERQYPVCLSTSISGCIGAHGEVWTCLNHRGNPKRKEGDLNTETLEEIFLRKSIALKDLHDCRLNCRNDQLNQELYSIMQNPAKAKSENVLPTPHKNFI